MKVDELEVTVGDTDLTVTMAEGDLVETGEGSIELKAKSIYVTIEDSVFQVLDEPTSWDKEAIKECVRNAWLEGTTEWPKTLDKEWTEPRYVGNADAQREVLELIVEHHPVTSAFLKQDGLADCDVGNARYNLKKQNLVKAISRNGQGEVLVPTHIGFKEYSTLKDLDVTKL